MTKFTEDEQSAIREQLDPTGRFSAEPPTRDELQHLVADIDPSEAWTVPK